MQLSSVQSNKIQLLASVPAHPDRIVCLCNKTIVKTTVCCMMSSFGSDRLSTETFWRLFTIGVGRLPKDFQRKLLAQGNKSLAHYLSIKLQTVFLFIFFKYVYFQNFQQNQIFSRTSRIFQNSMQWEWLLLRYDIFCCKKLKGLDSKSPFKILLFHSQKYRGFMWVNSNSPKSTQTHAVQNCNKYSLWPHLET